MYGVGRRRGAASSVGTRRKSIRGGSVATSMSPHGPAPGRGTTRPALPLLIGKQCFQAHVQAPAVERGIRVKPQVSSGLTPAGPDPPRSIG
ncbi:hypothetical protein XarbCFBP7697_14940 [Xanthomonas arboricola]|nr:hypothetical protein XarbCFBP7697_14940 [Xanthomonas arboricola]